MEAVFDEALGLWHRPGTTDLETVGEVKAYRLLPIKFSDVCLDLGANIGAASRLMLDMGAQQVIAVEAAPETAEICRKNLAGLSAVTLCAAVAARAGTATINVHVGRYQYSNSTVINSSKRVGVEVLAVTLTELFERYHPTVLKCDIEHAEHSLPELYALPNTIHALQIEIHYGQSDSPQVRTFRESGARLIKSFGEQGFQCLKMRGATPKAWNSESTWSR